MDPGALFSEAFEASCRVMDASPSVLERSFRIGGSAVHFRLAGHAMVKNVWPAISHLEDRQAAIESGLTVHVWDCESTGAPFPVSADIWNACTNWGELVATRGSLIHASRLMDVGVYSMVDLSSGQAVYWANRADHVPPYARAAAVRSILHVWMRKQRRIFLHGASVARDGQSILLAGKGGSGKTTTALLCASQGWQYLGDDYCLASAGESPRTYSVYNSAKLSPDQWNRFVHWTDSRHAVKDPQSGKTIVFLAYDSSVSVIPQGELRAIVLPTITGGKRSTLTADSPVAAWKAMALSTVLQLPGAAQEDLASIGSLARSVPCFRLSLGNDLESVPTVIASGIW